MRIEVERAVKACRGDLAQLESRLAGITLNGGVSFETVGRLVACDGLLRDALKTLPKTKRAKAPERTVTHE